MKTAALSTALLTALLCAFGCHRRAAAEDDLATAKVEGETITLPANSPALAGLTVEAAQPSAATPTRLNGRLVWNDDVTVRVFAPISGRVERVLAQSSQPIAAGDTLALIASPDYAQAQADAAKSAADFALAGRTLDRLRTLFEAGATAQKDVQAAEADFARTHSEKERAETIVRMRGGPAGGGEALFALKSPIGGVLVEKNLSPGQEVRPDQILANAPQFFAPLFVVSDPTRLWVIVDATDRDAATLSPGAALTVRSPALGDRTFGGQVLWVADALDPVTRMVRVRGRVENPDRRLKAEMFVTVEFAAHGVPDGSDVPTATVFMKGEKNFIYVEDQPGKYTRREVGVGLQHDGKIAVVRGLQAGDRVVTGGSLLLDEIRASAGGGL